MSKFTEELAARIAAKYQSRTHFLAAAEPEKKTDTQGGYLSLVLRGKAPPPMHRLQNWAKALDLDAEQTQRFFDLALIARLPEEYQPRFESLLAAAAPLMPTNISTEASA
jgi:hypothetical protein